MRSYNWRRVPAILYTDYTERLNHIFISVTHMDLMKILLLISCSCIEITRVNQFRQTRLAVHLEQKTWYPLKACSLFSRHFLFSSLCALPFMGFCGRH